MVLGQRAISVTLDDGPMSRAELVGIDPILDLALLRIAVPAKGLPVAMLGESDKIKTGSLSGRFYRVIFRLRIEGS